MAAKQARFVHGSAYKPFRAIPRMRLTHVCIEAPSRHAGTESQEALCMALRDVTLPTLM